MKFKIEYQNGKADPTKTWQEFGTLTGTLKQVKTFLREFHSADRYRLTDDLGNVTNWENKR